MARSGAGGVHERKHDGFLKSWAGVFVRFLVILRCFGFDVACWIILFGFWVILCAWAVSGLVLICFDGFVCVCVRCVYIFSFGLLLFCCCWVVFWCFGLSVFFPSAYATTS